MMAGCGILVADRRKTRVTSQTALWSVLADRGKTRVTSQTALWSVCRDACEDLAATSCRQAVHAPRSRRHGRPRPAAVDAGHARQRAGAALPRRGGTHAEVLAAVGWSAACRQPRCGAPRRCPRRGDGCPVTRKIEKSTGHRRESMRAMVAKPYDSLPYCPIVSKRVRRRQSPW